MVVDDITALIGADRENNPPIATISNGAYSYDVYVEVNGTRVVVLRQATTGFHPTDPRLAGHPTNVQIFDTYGDSLRYLAELADE